MSKPPHPLTMIGRTNPRILDDGCLTCLRSKVYCDAVNTCCPDCQHS